MKLSASILALVLAALATSSATAAEPLTIAQVEKVTGLSKLSVKPAKYDKSAKNFVTANNDVAVSVKLAPASMYDLWKSQPSMSDQTALAGVGEDALMSKKGRYVCFKKSSSGVCVTGMVSMPGSPALVNDEQLLQLARQAAAKL
jgi:hypothetical protein